MKLKLDHFDTATSENILQALEERMDQYRERQSPFVTRMVEDLSVIRFADGLLSDAADFMVLQTFHEKIKELARRKSDPVLTWKKEDIQKLALNLISKGNPSSLLQLLLYDHMNRTLAELARGGRSFDYMQVSFFNAAIRLDPAYQAEKERQMLEYFEAQSKRDRERRLAKKKQT